MKKRAFMIGILIAVLMISMISIVAALTTTIKVNTLGFHDVSIKFVKTMNDNELERINGTSDVKGIFTATSTSVSGDFALIFVVSKDKKFVVTPIRIGNFSAGKSYEFDVDPGSVTQITGDDTEETETETNQSTETETNETVETNTNANASDEELPAPQIETGQKSEDGITLFTTIKEKVSSITSKIKWNYFLYAVLIICVAGIIIVFVKKGGLKSRGKKVLVVQNKDKDNTEAEAVAALDNKRLLAAEEKIRAAQEEIDSIKEKETKMKEAEREFEVAKERLEKLKREKED